jgi:chemotaxis regulatin CheY-phosphate phosphatase CheZ
MMLSEQEYLAIEDEIASSPQGRAFLRAHGERASVVTAEEVRRLLRELMILRGDRTGADTAAQMHLLRRELEEMSGVIQRTREEIAALHHEDEKSNRIMLATGELDAIVSATERATSDILNCAERIQAAAARLPRTPDAAGAAEEISAQAMEITMACSFQDITGQRTMKVVNTLRYIEQRVKSMIAIWDLEEVKKAAFEPVDKRPDAHLMNGPSADAVSQDAIDEIFAEPAAPGTAPLSQGAVDELFD